jgi:hypothetical protein
VLTTDAYDIANLKGTYSILPSALRELSVLDGAIAWNTGTIRRLYDLGVLKDKGIAQKPTRPILKKGESHADYTTILNRFNEELNEWYESISVKKVVRKLFYRQPGTTSTADFKLTNKIKTLENKELENKEFAESIANVLSEIWLYHQISKQQGKVNDELSNKLLQFDFTGLFSDKKQGSVDAVKEALNDTVFDGYEVLRYSLLAALWVKCGSDREALKNYYNALKSVLPAKIVIYIKFVSEQLKQSMQMPEESQRFIKNLVDIAKELPQLDDNWVNEKFDKDSNPDLIKEIKSFKVDELQDTQQGPANYELFTYFMLMPSENPGDAPYDKAHLTIKNKKKENITFSDCMENVFRNLINHLAYDPETTRFSVDKLREITGKTVAKETVNAKLITFYATHSDAKKTTEPSAHDDWADMISDIPWVEYCKVLRGETNLEKSDRYIKIPESNLTAELNGFLVSHGYRRVEEREAIVYEVQPCLRNLIIVLDYLLNLGIFESKKLSEEFIKDDFVSTYLPKVFEKFGKISFDVAALDEVEFQKGGEVTIRLQLKAEYDVYISISIRGHGDFKSETLVRESLPMFKQMNSGDLKLLPVSMQLLLPQAIFKKQGFNDSVVSFFAQDIGNPSIVSDLLYGSDNNQLELNETKIKLLKFLISRNADANVRQRDLLCLYIDVVDANMKKFYKEAIDAATKGMNNKGYLVWNLALNLWKALVRR